MPSPSCLSAETPPTPSRASHGPSSRVQQLRVRRHSVNVPAVDRGEPAVTLTSWRASAGSDTVAGGPAGQFATLPGAAAEAVAKSARQATTTTRGRIDLIAAQGTLAALVRMVRTPIAVLCVAGVALVPARPVVAAAPPFSSSSAPATAAELGASYHPGCPVPPSQLRVLRLSYWGFDGRPHGGSIVVAAAVAGPVTGIFAALYRRRFPIRRLLPVARFRGSDDASMAADNTSGFNCRRAVAAGAPGWSAHAYGEAIDVNPVENPYIVQGVIMPPAGAGYRTRSPARAGMASRNGVLVAAFAAAGWQWGGRWSASPDYQHFSDDGS